MSFTIPTLDDLAKRARNSFMAEMKGVDAWIWPNNTGITAKVLSGLLWQLFKRMAWIDTQRFAMTATGYELERHGLEFGIKRRGASLASGYVYVESDYPLTIAAGTQFTRSDGVVYSATKAVSLSKFETVLQVPVACQKAGKTGNSIAGTPLSATATFTLAGSTTTPYVGDDGIGGGADKESLEQLRDRILLRKRRPPQGGSKWDYVQWAKQIPGVTRVWVKGNYYGAGTVAVWFTMDDTYEYGIPQAADVAIVQAHINTLKPVTAAVVVAAPIAYPIDVVVTDLSTSGQSLREKAAAEVRAAVLHNNAVSTDSTKTSVYVAWFWSAVASVLGSDKFIIASPLVDKAVPAGKLPVVRSVTFQ